MTVKAIGPASGSTDANRALSERTSLLGVSPTQNRGMISALYESNGGRDTAQTGANDVDQGGGPPAISL